MQSASGGPPPPYPVGTTLMIRPHRPPSAEEAEAQVTYEKEEALRKHDRLEAVLQFPAPITTVATVSSTTPDRSSNQVRERKLEIIQVLAAGWTRGPQLVLCRISQPSGPPGPQYVAKIFDPLYYREPQWQRHWWEPPYSLTKEANLEYSAECAAYQRIEAKKSTRLSSCTPDFHGCWSFEVSESGPSTSPNAFRVRSVCLVLLEYLSGRTMEDLAVDHNDLVWEHWYRRYNEPYRMAVLARLLEAENWLDSIGVAHGDLEAKNVMLSPVPNIDDMSSDPITLNPRVVLFDYNMSTLFNVDSSAQEGVYTQQEDLPENPMDIWWDEYYSEFLAWCPEWWKKDKDRRRRWLQEQFGGANASKFKKVKRTDVK